VLLFLFCPSQVAAPWFVVLCNRVRLRTRVRACVCVRVLCRVSTSSSLQLQDQRRKTDRLEDAFQRIRSATGLTDVDAIVEKFLNREDTNDRLVKQMADARARIEDLRSTHVRLQQLLDAQTMVKETQHENRQLYHKVDDFDRRLTEARHTSEEAKQRSFKVMITLEESRACIAKLLNKLDFDPTAQQAHSRRGNRAGRTAGGSTPTSPRALGSMSSMSATLNGTGESTVDGFRVQHGKLVVSVDTLPQAVRLVRHVTYMRARARARVCVCVFLLCVICLPVRLIIWMDLGEC